MNTLKKLTLIMIVCISQQVSCMETDLHRYLIEELRAEERPTIDFVAGTYERTPLTEFLKDIELKPAIKAAPAYRDFDCTIITPEKQSLKNKMVKAGEKLLKSQNQDNARELLNVLEEMRVLTLKEVLELSKKRKFVPLSTVEEDYIQSFKTNNQKTKKTINDLKIRFNIKD